MNQPQRFDPLIASRSRLILEVEGDIEEINLVVHFADRLLEFADDFFLPKKGDFFELDFALLAFDVVLEGFERVVDFVDGSLVAFELVVGIEAVGVWLASDFDQFAPQLALLVVDSVDFRVQ